MSRFERFQQEFISHVENEIPNIVESALSRLKKANKKTTIREIGGEFMTTAALLDVAGEKYPCDGALFRSDETVSLGDIFDVACKPKLELV